MKHLIIALSLIIVLMGAGYAIVRRGVAYKAGKSDAIANVPSRATDFGWLSRKEYERGYVDGKLKTPAETVTTSAGRWSGKPYTEGYQSGSQYTAGRY